MKNNWFCKYKLAHRGLHNKVFPENSLGAFQNASNHSFGIELDVRLLKDDTVVVFHDANLKRMCDKDIELRDLTIDNLKEYKLLNSHYTIPTLQEVLDLINDSTPIMIELKPLRNREKLAPKLYEILKNYDGRIAVKSFNPFAMLWFKKHAPKIPRGMLSCSFDNIYLPLLYKVVLKKLLFFKFINPDFISYKFEDLPNKYITKKKVPILTWTIQNEEQEKSARKVAKNIIFENYIPKNPMNYR